VPCGSTRPSRRVSRRVLAVPASVSRPAHAPLGIVTSGCGWVQREGGPVEEIRPGDVVWFPPGEKHWHGATATTGMSHVAIAEALDGKAVDWMEQVTDEQYQPRPRTNPAISDRSC
jgi:gentisate 1,2-dioxygenase